jgi:hypothetical protein
MEEAIDAQIHEHTATVSPNRQPTDSRQGAEAWWFNFVVVRGFEGMS